MSPDFRPDFAAGLLDASRALPAGLAARHAADQRRFAVYRNNVAVGLVDALAAAYPVTEKLVGTEFFRAAARLFALDNPPASPVMLDYGDGFAEFLETFPPAAALPFLADVARIERAALECWHAADAGPLAIAALAELAPEALADCRLVVHPAARVVRSRFSAATIWRANAGPGEPGRIDASVAEDVLVARPDMDVAVHLLPAGAAVLFLALGNRATLAEAAGAALGEADDVDFEVALAALFAAGAVIAIEHGRA